MEFRSVGGSKFEIDLDSYPKIARKSEGRVPLVENEKVEPASILCLHKDSLLKFRDSVSAPFSVVRL